MDKIAVLDFGGQYAHLIANRIRRLGVYSEIHEGDVSASELSKYKGLILSGGPASVAAADSVKCDPAIFELGIPILGICYGHQLIAHTLGGRVDKGEVREYGHATVKILKKEAVWEDLDDTEDVWMSHFDQVHEIPEGFEVAASSGDCDIAAMFDGERKIYSVQFHPEVTHTPHGMKILKKFVDLCGASRDWDIDKYIENILEEIKVKVGDRKVFLMISGGVDSTVAFLLLEKALGAGRVYGLFVDTGFMRWHEREEVENALKQIGVTNLHVYDASSEYFSALEGIYEPEEKRKIIGDLFIDIQAKVSDELGLNPDEWMLGQGTIYPDWIETGGSKHADTIKTHHNRVERIRKLEEEGKVIEPLVQLYKDEVRMVGDKLGLIEEMVWRHPFPGPGLAVRTLCARGEDFPENVTELEARMASVVSDSGLKVKVLPIKSVGVQGDERTYKHPAVLYGKRVSWDELNRLSTQLTNQFPDVNRLLYGLNFNKIDDLKVPNVWLTRERNLVIQKADRIVMELLHTANIHREIWQFPTVLIPVILEGVGSQNGESLVLRPVCSTEAMTANFYQMNFEVLDDLVGQLEAMDGISGIFYDITNKPPGTIEWE